MIQSTDSTIILGDFNIPTSEWIVDDYDSNVLIPTNTRPAHAAEFIGNIVERGFMQVNSIVNHQNKLLDLIFTNDHLNCELVNPKPLSKVDVYHPPLMLIIEWHFTQSNE